MLGASWSPNASRTTCQAATRSARSAEATYTVDFATSPSEQPAAVEGDDEVLHHPTCLPGHVAGADHAAVLVERTRAGGEDQVADHGGVGIGRGVGEGGGADELDGHAAIVVRGSRRFSLAVAARPGQAHPMGYDVRPAEAKDLPLLAEIEGAADQLFTSVFGDLDWEPPTDGEVRAAEPGFLLVAGDPAVGFVHVLFLDDAAHLQQLAVHPESMGRGVGTALLDGACAEARRRGLTPRSR